MDDGHSRPLGVILVEGGLITRDELEESLAEQATDGRPLGEILVDRGYISRPALARHLALQSGAELSTQGGFGYGLFQKLEQGHRRARADERRNGEDRRQTQRRTGDDRRADARAPVSPAADDPIAPLETTVDEVERWMIELEVALEHAAQQLRLVRGSFVEARVD